MNEIKPSVHPDLKAHQDGMKPKIYKLRDHIYCAFGFTVVNCTLIEGEESCILVDTMTGMDNAAVVAEEFKKITDKPIKTVIYTHFHADHVSGTRAFLTDEEISSGEVKIIGQKELADHVMRDVGLVGPIIGRRAMYQFGMRLPVSEEGTVGAGLGPPQRPGPRSFVPPNTTFESVYRDEVGGIKFEVHLNPSETEDQCCVWLPDEKVLLSADAIYESFPNVYALRGTRFRNPMVWAQGIDHLREFGAELLIPHHGRPVEGADEIDALMTDYRDAIQFVHDQTLRYMNKGYRPDEIKEVVEMPDRLKDHPWLGEYYGSYKHSIPAIYAGYLGWYQGDPVALSPTPWREKAKRYVVMMGGRSTVLAKAREAIDSGDDQWGAELLTWLIQADVEDREARNLKARALRAWGYRQKNATWRNWGLTSALELEGELDLAGGGMVLGSPDQVRGFPLAAILQVMTVRLKAEEAWDTSLRVAFETTDTNEACALEIRRGVCQFFRDPPAERDAAMKFSREFLLKWVFGQTTLEEAIAAGDVTIDGEAATVTEFISKFEAFNEATDISVAAR